MKEISSEAWLHHIHAGSFSAYVNTAPWAIGLAFVFYEIAGVLFPHFELFATGLGFLVGAYAGYYENADPYAIQLPLY